MDPAETGTNPAADEQALSDAKQWLDLRERLAARRDKLGAAEHQLLAIAADLTGQPQLALSSWELAHAAWTSAGDLRRSAYTAFWMGMDLVQQRQLAPAQGWFARGRRMLEEAGLDCPELARFDVPGALAMLSSDPAQSLATFRRVYEKSVRFDDREGAALAQLGAGQALIQLGRVPDGVAMLDEAMAAALAGDVMPIATGIIYCGLILECRRIFDVRRAREWTVALQRWCDGQQGLVPFRGQCLVHRSEIAQLDGDWQAALGEATAACDWLADVGGGPLHGMAVYQRAELFRLRGEFAAAEADYRLAAQLGRRAEPGLQLLLLACGKPDLAAAGIRRARSEATSPVQRARILAAFAEIMLAAGAVEDARGAVDELLTLAEDFASPQLQASAAYGRAAVLLADGDAEEALEAAVRSEELWRRLAAPYDAARAQLLRATACERLGDTETGRLYRAAGSTTLVALGATTDLALVVPEPAHAGLSAREVEVITLVSRGLTNREIARALVLSEKTVARHLSNIFAKTGVASRAAATAWAFSHGLVDR